MKINKIFIFLMLMLGIISSVNAINTNGGVAYWTADNILTDLTGNGYTLTNSGTSFNSSGKINQAFGFDGINDYVTRAHNSVFTTTAFSVSYWLYIDTAQQGYTLFKDAGGNNNHDFSMVYQVAGNLEINMQTGGTSPFLSTPLSVGSWHFITFTSDGANNHNLYVNGTLKDTDTISWTINGNAQPLYFGSWAGSNPFDGLMDEIYWTNYEMTTDNITDLYNIGDGCQYNFTICGIIPDLSFSNITADNITLVNNSYFNDSLLTIQTNILNTSTNGNVNQTYNLTKLYRNQTILTTSLNERIININSIDTYCSQQGFSGGTNLVSGSPQTTAFWSGSDWVDLTLSTPSTLFSCDDSNQQYATNNLNGSFNKTLNVDGEYNLNLFAFNSETNVSTNYIFFIDTTNPTINNSIPVEINSYEFDGSLFSCSDVNIDSCNISINGFNQASGINFTLNNNGNLSYNITSIDLAGNTISESGVLYVNPYIYLYFNNTITSNLISNYSIGGVLNPLTEYKEKYFNLYDGNSNLTLEFIKSGYITTDVVVQMLNNETINQTFDILPVNLFIKVYDSVSFAQINFDLIIQNGNISSYTGLTEFNQSFPNIPLGDIKITVSQTGYSDGIVYATIVGNSAIEYNIYITPTNVSSVIAFNVKDFNDNTFLEGVLVEARQIINSSEITVQQTLTGSNGVAYLNLNPNIPYEFIFTKDGYVLGNINAVPGVITYTIKLRSESTVYQYLDDVSLRIEPTKTVIYGGETIDFKAFISGTSLTLSSITLIDDLGNTLYSDSSTNPTGTTFEYSKLFLNDTNISKVTMNIEYITDGNTKSFSRIFNVFSLQDSGVKQFTDFNEETDEEARLFRFFIIITTFASFIILGSRNQQTRDFVSLLTIFPLIIFTYVGWIPYLYATIMFLAMIVFFMGGNKR